MDKLSQTQNLAPMGPETTCRFCGFEDENNICIFSANKNVPPTLDKGGGEDLLNKISTVYPFVMYENDPLPQQICPNCIENVNMQYRDIQQVLKHQKMLMNMIRTKQPGHEYFRILQEIDKSARITKMTIKASYNVDINQNTPIKLLTFPTNDTTVPSLIPLSASNKPIQKPVNEKLVKNIQTKLEMNGFTIKRIKVNPPDVEKIVPPQTIEEKIKCPCCTQHFPTQKALAQHQVKHMKMSTGKIFEQRLLPKHLRRGRLIAVDNEKHIRCLNCWQVFQDNSKILQHWSCSNCYFFCFICGKEFPHSPKQLREHMPSVHGISFRSTMKQYVVSRTGGAGRAIGMQAVKHKLQQEPMWKKPPTHTIIAGHPVKLIVNTHKKKKKYYKGFKSSTKNSDGTFSCNVCFKTFTNYRSSNSHMRIHNLPGVYDEDRNVYTSSDEMLLPDQPQISTVIQNKLPIRVAGTSTSVRPPYKILTNNEGPLRGIKTKIVQKRNDFIANNGNMRAGTADALCNSSSNSWATEENVQQPIDWNPTMGTDAYSAGATADKYASPLAVVKSEPLDEDNNDFTNQWNCFICHENFAGSKEYEMHVMFVHNLN